MVLAAGVGSRLRPVTDKLPKPMVPIGGAPLLEHTVTSLARQGVHEIVLNLHYLPEVITDHFGDGSAWGVAIRYSYEPRLLGTAGALVPWRSLFDSTFLLVYGDNLLTIDVAALVAWHRRHEALATVALFERDDTSQSGVAELAEDGRIVRFVEKPRPGETTSRWVNAGMLVLEPAAIDLLPEGVSDFGRDLLPQWIDDGRRVVGYRMAPPECLQWIDTLDDLARVRRAFES